jgi:hypothetical protein
MQEGYEEKKGVYFWGISFGHGGENIQEPWKHTSSDCYLRLHFDSEI